MSINYGLGEKGCVFLLLLAKLHFEIFMGFQPSFSPLFSLFRQAAEANIPCSEKACDPLICFQNINPLGLPWWLRWYSICLQRGRLRFDSWVGKIPWRRKWQPTPVLLPGKSHGRRSIVGYSPWGHKESDTTKQLHSLTQTH